MIRRVLVILIALLIGSSTGCFRTHYMHLYGEDDKVPVAFSGEPLRQASGWQSFFLFGWVPGEQEIESGRMCGDKGVLEVKTQQSFAQGLVTALTSLFYVNIYAPWTGKTVCG